MDLILDVKVFKSKKKFGRDDFWKNIVNVCRVDVFLAWDLKSLLNCVYTRNSLHENFQRLARVVIFCLSHKNQVPA